MRVLFVLVASVLSMPVSADLVWGVNIEKIYTQSTSGSSAHLIKVSGTLSSPVCSQNRLYIDFQDKELYSSALANYISGKPVDLVYVTNASPRTASGHVADLTCKVVSIF